MHRNVVASSYTPSLGMQALLIFSVKGSCCYCLPPSYEGIREELKLLYRIPQNFKSACGKSTRSSSKYLGQRGLASSKYLTVGSGVFLSRIRSKVSMGLEWVEEHSST